MTMSVMMTADMTQRRPEDYDLMYPYVWSEDRFELVERVVRG